MLMIVNMAKSTPAMMSHQIIGVQRNQEDILETWSNSTPLHCKLQGLCKAQNTSMQNMQNTNEHSHERFIWQYNALWTHKSQGQGQAIFSETKLRILPLSE